MSDDLDERIDERLETQANDRWGPYIPHRFAWLIIAALAFIAYCW